MSCKKHVHKHSRRSCANRWCSRFSTVRSFGRFHHRTMATRSTTVLRECLGVPSMNIHYDGEGPCCCRGHASGLDIATIIPVLAHRTKHRKIQGAVFSVPAASLASFHRSNGLRRLRLRHQRRRYPRLWRPLWRRRPQQPTQRAVGALRGSPPGRRLPRG